MVRSLVPVSVRTPDEHGVITNRVSAVLANLPVGEPDPVRRLQLIRGEMDEIKRTSQAVGAELLTGMLGLTLPTLMAYGVRAAFQVPQPLVQTVTTNVPGPPIPLYLLGRKLRQLHPYVPIGDSVHISVAILSYLGRLVLRHHGRPGSRARPGRADQGSPAGPGGAGPGRGGRPGRRGGRAPRRRG